MTDSLAWKVAINLLARQDYSKIKLKKKLVQRGFDLDEVEDTIAKLVKVKYLIEENYIEARVKGFMNKNCSPYFIQQKLKAEGLDVALDNIREIFKEYQISESTQIERLIRKKLPANIPDEPEDIITLTNKILTFLKTKGHRATDSIEILENCIRH